MQKLLVIGLLICNLNGVCQQAGEIWGMTNAGGSDGGGVIFKTDANGSNFSVVNHFSVSNPGSGATTGGMIQANNGKLYGVTPNGGSSAVGVLFEYDIATNMYTRRLDFNLDRGMRPTGSLLQADNGKLYGLTSEGGANNAGVIFEFDPMSLTYAKKYDFPSASQVTGSLIQAPNSKLYGITSGGGTLGQGTLFEYDISSNTFLKKK